MKRKLELFGIIALLFAIVAMANSEDALSLITNSSNFTANVSGQPAISSFVTFVAGNNTTLTQSGNNITIDSTGGSGSGVDSVIAYSPLTYEGTTDVTIFDNRTDYPNSTAVTANTTANNAVQTSLYNGNFPNSSIPSLQANDTSLDYRITNRKDIDYVVFYENGLAYALHSNGSIISGSNNATVLQSALSGVGANGEVKLVTDLTLDGNIDVPIGTTLSSTTGLTGYRNGVWNPTYMNDNDLLNTSPKILLNSSYLISMYGDSTLKDIVIISKDLNTKQDYVSSEVAWNGTAIRILGKWTNIYNVAIFGFNLGISIPSDVPGRIERVNMDNINGINISSPLTDVQRISNVHMWVFAATIANGTYKNYRNGTAIYSVGCANCIISDIFIYGYKNGVVLSGSANPITLTDVSVDGANRVSSSTEVYGFKFINNVSVVVTAGYAAVGWSNGVHTSYGYYSDTSNVLLIGTYSRTNSYEYYSKNSTYSYIGTKVDSVVDSNVAYDYFDLYDSGKTIPHINTLPYTITLTNYIFGDCSNCTISQLSTKVNKSGDTINGNLNINGAETITAVNNMLNVYGTGTQTGLRIKKSDAATNAKYFEILNFNTTTTFRFVNDAYSHASDILVLEHNTDSENILRYKIFGNVTVARLTGSGNATVCVDANGILFRSTTGC